MKKIFVYLPLCLLLFSIAVSAQEKFDVVSFKTPKGWQKSDGANAVQFTKQAGNGVAIMMLFKSLPTNKDSKTTFDASWDSIVKELLTKVDSPKMQPIIDKNGWTIESGAAIGEKDGEKLVAMLISATGGGKVVNLLILYNSESFQADIESFISSLDLEKLSQSSVKNNSKMPTNQTRNNSPISESNSNPNQLTGKIWQGSVSEKFSNGFSTGGFWTYQYRFYPDGTYKFVYVGASAYAEMNLLQYESGTYSVNGNQLTITPTSGTNEEWSVVGGKYKIAAMSDVGIRKIKESWDKKVKSEKRKLEKYTYTFSVEYLSDIQKNNLILEYNEPTQREDKGNRRYFEEKKPDKAIKLPNGIF